MITAWCFAVESESGIHEYLVLDKTRKNKVPLERESESEIITAVFECSYEE